MKIQHIIENLPAQSHTGQIQNNLCYCKTMLFINDPTSDATKTGADKEPASEGFQSHNPPPCDGDSPATPISDGDIAGQFTRVMGKGENENDVFENSKL